MRDIIDWANSFQINDRPWLLLGKGPSFSKIDHYDLNEFYTCSLNHVVREIPVTLAHIIDIDVVVDCAEFIDQNARFLVLPYYPHVNCKPQHKTIVDFIKEIPILQKLDQENRLLCYNLSNSPPFNSSPIITAIFFSAEAALNLLVECGATNIRSLGVDGGSSYSGIFNDLNDKTLLKNRHTTFDHQFDGIANTIRRKNIFYAPLSIDAPIRVFIGMDKFQKLPARMLEYSIKKVTSMSVEFFYIDDADLPIPHNPQNRTKTGFSFARFKIPQLCNYKGRGIYLDADMQVFKNLMTLWTFPMNEADILTCKPSSQDRDPQFSVMLLNCGNLQWDATDIVTGLDREIYTYAELLGKLCIVTNERQQAILPAEWNSLEFYEQDKTHLIHYTDMPTQPWISPKNQFGYLWYNLVKEALAEEFLTIDEIHHEIRMGHVSPDLLNWLGLSTPIWIKVFRRKWVPPFMRFSTVQKKENFFKRCINRLKKTYVTP